MKVVPWGLVILAPICLKNNKETKLISVCLIWSLLCPRPDKSFSAEFTELIPLGPNPAKNPLVLYSVRFRLFPRVSFQTRRANPRLLLFPGVCYPNDFPFFVAFQITLKKDKHVVCLARIFIFTHSPAVCRPSQIDMEMMDFLLLTTKLIQIFN